MQRYRSILPDMMADLSDRQKYDVRHFASNLWAARWLLVTAMVAVFAVFFLADLPWLVIPGAIVILLLVAGLTGSASHQRQEHGRKAANRGNCTACRRKTLRPPSPIR